MADPRFSVSQITTFHQSLDEDLANYKAAGAEGIGIWEFKLPEGKDTESLAKVRDSGLKVTTCIPATLSIWPVPFPGPQDPDVRTQGLCDAIGRFAPFEPDVVLCLTGPPPAGVEPAEGRRVVVEGLRRAAKVAGEHGLILGLEPLHRKVYGHWSLLGDIPGTIEMMDEIGEPNVKLMYDLYHLWDTDDVIEQTVRLGDRMCPGVHICDWRADTRNDFDRALPGEGIMDTPALLGALDATGAMTWVDLEIFSDDGSFSDMDFPDSLWKQDPVEVVARAKAGFEKAWAARKAP